MASYIPTLCLTGFNTAAIHVGSDTFKLALGTGTVPTANRDGANQYYAGSDFNSQASGAGYTTGGNTVTLSGAAYTTGGVHQYAVANSALSSSWAAATLTSVTYAYLYDDTASPKYVVAVWDFGGAQSVTANTFSVNFTDTAPNYRVWYWSVA
jgi:hypothetical protein